MFAMTDCFWAEAGSFDPAVLCSCCFCQRNNPPPRPAISMNISNPRMSYFGARCEPATFAAPLGRC